MKLLYEDLKPNERIFKLINEYIFPDLKQLGFKFNKSDLTIKRKILDVEQGIYFQKNRHNISNIVVAFKPGIYVKSKTYYNWCIEKYGSCDHDIIGAKSADYIPNWNVELYNGWYDLAKMDNILIMKSLKNNIFNAALPLIEIYSDKARTIDFEIHQSNHFHYAPKLFDLAYLINDKIRAEKVLSWFDLEFKKSKPEDWVPETLSEIEDRKNTFKNWA